MAEVLRNLVSDDGNLERRFRETSRIGLRWPRQGGGGKGSTGGERSHPCNDKLAARELWWHLAILPRTASFVMRALVLPEFCRLLRPADGIPRRLSGAPQLRRFPPDA